MTTNTDHDENADGSNSAQPTPQNCLQAALTRLTGEPPRVEGAVDVHGRYWLQDRENPDEAYIWSRKTIDVEAVR